MSNRFSRVVRPTVYKNHYRDLTNGAVAGVELITDIGIGIDAATNRSTHIPEGSVLKTVVVELFGETVPTAAYKVECMLYLEKQGTTSPAAPMASFYSATDPLTNDSLVVRKGIMTRPETRTFPGNQVGGPLFHFTCRWRGIRHINDGDNVKLVFLSSESLNVGYHIWLSFVHN